MIRKLIDSDSNVSDNDDYSKAKRCLNDAGFEDASFTTADNIKRNCKGTASASQSSESN